MIKWKVTPRAKEAAKFALRDIFCEKWYKLMKGNLFTIIVNVASEDEIIIENADMLINYFNKCTEGKIVYYLKIIEEEIKVFLNNEYHDLKTLKVYCQKFLSDISDIDSTPEIPRIRGHLTEIVEIINGMEVPLI